MLKILEPIIFTFLRGKALKKLLLDIAKAMVKKSDNTIDDRLVEVLEKARKLAPESQLVGNNYATALRGVGRIEESLEVLKNLKNGEDSEEINHAIKAQQYRIEEKYELAEKEFRAAISKDPKEISLYTNLGSLLIEREKFDEAEVILEKAISIKDVGAVTHMNLGFLYLKKKKYDKAQAQSEIAVKLNPKSSTSWLNLGLSYVHQGKINEAREAWNRALDLDPDNEQLINNLKAIEE